MGRSEPVGMRRAVLWKRGWVVINEAGSSGVMGGFAKEPVPLEAAAPCEHGGDAYQVERECSCGFSAHITRLGALRYRPRTGPLLLVELGGIATAGNGSYALGLTQRAVAVEFCALCPLCDTPKPAARLVLHPIGKGWSQVDSVCDEHASDTQMVDPSVLGVEMRVASLDLSRYQWRFEATSSAQAVPDRCSCDRAQRLTDPGGLRHYVRSLWEWGDTLSNGDVVMVCRRCGIRWLYQRTREPASAKKLPPPGNGLPSAPTPS